MMPDRTSWEALAISGNTGSGCALALFSRRRRNTFSTPTTASSTSSPMEILQPCCAPEIADQILARMLIDKAACGIGPELLEGGLDLGASDIQIGHLRKVERDPVLRTSPPIGITWATPGMVSR